MPSEQTDDEWDKLIQSVSETICIESDDSVFLECQEDGQSPEENAKHVRSLLAAQIERERSRLISLACEKYDGAAKTCHRDTTPRMILRIFLDGCPEAHCLFSLPHNNIAALSDGELDGLCEEWSRIRQYASN
jgi:hypothetical protein